MSLLTKVVPPWACWCVLILAFGATAAIFQMRGERIAGERHINYVIDQANQSVRINKGQTQVVVQTEIKYRDRIKTIYVQGDVIEKEVPVYVTQTDNDRCSINAGFVRSYNAAWTGEPAGPADSSDREPAGVSLADVAQADAFNGTVCRVWQEQALGWREFYSRLKDAIDDPSSVQTSALK